MERVSLLPARGLWGLRGLEGGGGGAARHSRVIIITHTHTRYSERGRGGKRRRKRRKRHPGLRCTALRCAVDIDPVCVSVWMCRVLCHRPLFLLIFFFISSRFPGLFFLLASSIYYLLHYYNCSCCLLPTAATLPCTHTSSLTNCRFRFWKRKRETNNIFLHLFPVVPVPQHPAIFSLSHRIN